MLSIYKHASSTAHFPLPYFPVDKNSWFLSPNTFSSVVKVTIQVTSTWQAMKQWNIYFSFLMVFTGRESINSFLTLFRMGRGESAKMPLTSFPQLCILVLILLSYCCKILGSYLVPVSNYWTWTKTTQDFSLLTGTFQNRKKIGIQVISLLFESASSSIEVFWGASDLLGI